MFYFTYMTKERNEATTQNRDNYSSNPYHKLKLSCVIEIWKNKSSMMNDFWDGKLIEFLKMLFYSQVPLLFEKRLSNLTTYHSY